MQNVHMHLKCVLRYVPVWENWSADKEIIHYLRSPIRNDASAHPVISQNGFCALEIMKTQKASYVTLYPNQMSMNILVAI